MAKVYNALLLNHMEPEIGKISRQKSIHNITDSDNQKNLDVTHLYIYFPKVFDSIYRGKMEQILLEYGLPKETVTGIMMLYSNMNVKVCSLDGDTDFFDIYIYIYTHMHIYV